jgi:hypothetical protein
MHQIWAHNNPDTVYLTSIINFNYSIPFSICHNTTKWKELFSLKGTTFVAIKYTTEAYICVKIVYCVRN